MVLYRGVPLPEWGAEAGGRGLVSADEQSTLSPEPGAVEAARLEAEARGSPQASGWFAETREAHTMERAMQVG
jgi:hypothetical protein